MIEPVVEYRRALHRIPELGLELPETLAFVRARLEKLPCRLASPAPGSLCAFFDAGRADAVALRADMDALPVAEETGLPFASEKAGRMHACGHDGHTALLLALADFAAAHLAELPRNALFLFQPGEEGPGGARPLTESGVLEAHRVRRVFGLHLWPGLPGGTVWTRPGPLMASANEVTLLLTGRGVHISRWQEGRDALLAGTEFLRRAYAMADGELPEGEPRLLRFGKMVSGTVRNAVSGRTVLEGSLRSYSEETARYMKRRLGEIAEAVAAESGCAASLTITDGYPPVRNDAPLLAEVSRALGADAPRTLAEPVLAAEDFSFYQRRTPGAFFFLGVGDTAPLHAGTFDFDDERVLPAGLEFWKKLLLLP